MAMIVAETEGLEVVEVDMQNAEGPETPLMSPETPVEATTVERTKAEDWSKGRDGASWMRQCSSHLSHIEKRLMENEYLGHEVHHHKIHPHPS